jgi:hypothetical protein
MDNACIDNRVGRIEGTIQKVSKNPYGWNSTPRGIIIPTAEGDVDVSIPGNRWIGDNGNLYYTINQFPNGDIEVYSNEDYTYGHFHNARRTDPTKNVVFSASRTASGVWEITKNDLPEGYVKPSPPNTYWEQRGRYYWNE